ncbi:hypothetical protein GCM10023321_50530 [Pseudonocardia eucalypti]|uniref:Uncharacterized protein n=1 Tax=Pseudonocardia eucalypti TaxID=648755 RepID=A0ABP9QKP7_9PSEU
MLQRDAPVHLHGEPGGDRASRYHAHRLPLLRTEPQQIRGVFHDLADLRLGQLDHVHGVGQRARVEIGVQCVLEYPLQVAEPVGVVPELVAGVGTQAIQLPQRGAKPLGQLKQPRIHRQPGHRQLGVRQCEGCPLQRRRHQLPRIHGVRITRCGCVVVTLRAGQQRLRGRQLGRRLCGEFRQLADICASVAVLRL